MSDPLDAIVDRLRRIEAKQDEILGNQNLQKHALSACSDRIEELRDHVMKQADHTGQRVRQLERSVTPQPMRAVGGDSNGGNGGGTQ